MLMLMDNINQSPSLREANHFIISKHIAIVEFRIRRAGKNCAKNPSEHTLLCVSALKIHKSLSVNFMLYGLYYLLYIISKAEAAK